MVVQAELAARWPRDGHSILGLGAHAGGTAGVGDASQSQSVGVSGADEVV